MGLPRFELGLPGPEPGVIVPLRNPENLSGFSLNQVTL